MANSTNDAFEPLLADNNDRFTMFPIKYREIWEVSVGMCWPSVEALK